jgi:hypothetical protein
MISEKQIGKNAERSSYGHIWNTTPKSDWTDTNITANFSEGRSPLSLDLNLGMFHIGNSSADFYTSMTRCQEDEFDKNGLQSAILIF